MEHAPIIDTMLNTVMCVRARVQAADDNVSDTDIEFDPALFAEVWGSFTHMYKPNIII